MLSVVLIVRLAAAMKLGVLQMLLQGDWEACTVEPPHGMIEESYHYCPKDDALEGGIWGKGPFKKFGPEQPLCKVAEWRKITQEEFKKLAHEKYGVEWSKEIPFWANG